MAGEKEGMNDRSPMTSGSDNGARMPAAMQTSNKKRKSMDIHGDNDNYHHQESTKDLSNSHDNDNDNKDPGDTDWEKLFYALQTERVTKAEALLYAYIRESEEREKLMRSYNQELENENQMLRSKANKASENLQQQQELQNQVEALQAQASQQSATIRAYQQLTGATLSNVRNDTGIAPKQTDNSSNSEVAKSESNVDNGPAAGTLDCVCIVKNPDTKISTKFRISTVSNEAFDKEGEKQQVVNAMTILKYQPLENADPLPGFLHEVIEFESSQLPPLLQNVLRGIFPEEEEEE